MSERYSGPNMTSTIAAVVIVGLILLVGVKLLGVAFALMRVILILVVLGVVVYAGLRAVNKLGR